MEVKEIIDKVYILKYKINCVDIDKIDKDKLMILIKKEILK